ncbi:hypothetical protein HZH66_011480 [Vespula vulgaris]|uniref:Uncharacterized protein n=1 Tax=Vespula vulgaris TaxID=7454 RepID=A0A834MWH5_VESVU|nr:hypothetical protein HZH66_011480 [Vespula vulgaris]
MKQSRGYISKRFPQTVAQEDYYWIVVSFSNRDDVTLRLPPHIDTREIIEEWTIEGWIIEGLIIEGTSQCITEEDLNQLRCRPVSFSTNCNSPTLDSVLNRGAVFWSHRRTSQVVKWFSSFLRFISFLPSFRIRVVNDGYRVLYSCWWGKKQRSGYMSMMFPETVVVEGSYWIVVLFWKVRQISRYRYILISMWLPKMLLCNNFFDNNNNFDFRNSDDVALHLSSHVGEIIKGWIIEGWIIEGWIIEGTVKHDRSCLEMSEADGVDGGVLRQQGLVRLQFSDKPETPEAERHLEREF